jgi:40-residue YVTN family beta-propeller repeat
LTALAALAAVAAILTVVLVVRPSTELVAGSGKPTGAPVATTSALSASGLSAESVTSQSSAESSSVSAVAPTPSNQTPFVNQPPTPVPSVAIPTVDGDPIPVGQTPGFVAISPDGRVAYIANRDAGVVTVLDMTINRVIARIPVPAGPPWFIALTPDGSHAYVSIYNADKTINLVAVLDTRTTKLLGTIPVEQKPYALAVSPDQRFVYVPSHDTRTSTSSTSQRMSSFKK